MKILIIVFSCNRALQLEALLESIFHFWKTPIYEIHVLFRASSNYFLLGYNQLKKSYPSVVFHQETNGAEEGYSLSELTSFYNLKLLYLCPHLRGHKSDFRRQLFNILKQNRMQIVMFLTDDSVCFRPIELSEDEMTWLLENPTQRQFSLRHGQELSGGRQLQSTGKGFEWRFCDFNSNCLWGYRFSLDGHLYHRKTVVRLLRGASFSNPNSLESGGFLHACHKNFFNDGRCMTNSCLLSYPINIVQTTFPNASMNAEPIVLNDYYLKGYSLQYPPIETISSFQVYPEQVFLVRGNERISLPTRLLNLE